MRTTKTSAYSTRSTAQLAFLAGVFSAPAALGQTPQPTPSTYAAPPPPPAPTPRMDVPLAEALTGAAAADYGAGRILYNDGDFGGAALKFQQAYEQSKDPRLLWNIAAARKGERQYAEVDRLVRRYITEMPTLSPDERARADSLLTTIGAFIATLTITVDQPGASVTVDGLEVGPAPLPEGLRVDIGERKVVVSKPGFLTHTETLKVTSDTSLTINLAPDVHEGRLRVLSPPDATVMVDGKRVTGGSWEGVLPSGPHSVQVTAEGKLPYSTEAVVEDGQTSTLRVELQTESGAKEQSNTWLWVALAAVALGGAAAGGYFLLNPEEATTPGPQETGSLDTIELGRLRF